MEVIRAMVQAGVDLNFEYQGLTYIDILLEKPVHQVKQQNPGLLSILIFLEEVGLNLNPKRQPGRQNYLIMYV